MKKLTFKMLGRLMALTLMLCSGLAASAAEVDLGAMALNTVYDCPAYQYVKGSFTPKTDGVYKINYATSDRFAIYTDAEMTIPYENGGEWAYFSDVVEGVKTTGYETWNFVGGTTYYFGGSSGSGLFIMNSNAKVVITVGSSDIEINSFSPEENSTMTTGGTAQVDVAFNCNVKVQSVKVSAGTQSEILNHSDAGDSKVRIYGNTVSILLKDLLQSWYEAGVIVGGEKLSLTLCGVRNANNEDIMYGENGELTINYIIGEQPATLISSVNTPDQMPSLKSFYFDDDQSGTIALTFSRELQNNPKDMPYAKWGIGNKESETGDYYEEILPCVVEGNTIYINLQGKLRNISTMELSSVYEDVQLDVSNVKTIDGSYVYSEGSGKLGSFNYLYKMQYIECDIVAEFTPSKGAIYEGDELEIWIMGESNLRYDGVEFVYGDGSTVVKDFVKIADPEDDKASILTVVVPKLVDAEGVEIAAGTEVEVLLSNVKAADGYDHSNDVKAKYTYDIKESVDSIATQDRSYDVYDFNGVKKLEGATADQLRSLDKGLYIINGRKVIVK